MCGCVCEGEGGEATISKKKQDFSLCSNLAIDIAISKDMQSVFKDCK